MSSLIPRDINKVYEVFENIRTHLDDCDIVSEISNYFDVDQFAGFCESIITDYDLDPEELGITTEYEDD